MSWTSRRALLVLAALAVIGMAVAVQHAIAQRVARPPVPPAGPPGAPGAPAKKEGFDLGSLTLPKDDDLKDRVDAAMDRVKEKDWARATKTLQELVGRSEDTFVPRETTDGEGKEVTAYVSVKKEANRLIGALPREGRTYYEVTYGPKAAGMLKQARTNNDAQLMGQVVGLYFFTEAGAEASAWLGTYMLDRGDFQAAARFFLQLVNRSGIKDLSDKTLLKAAYAFHHAGDKDSKESVYKELERRRAELKLRTEATSVADLQDYINRLVASSVQQSASDSPFYRGRSNRNAILPGGTPFLEASWRKKMVETEDAARQVKLAEDQIRTRNQPVLSDFFPVTATVSRGEKKIPLIIYRSFLGVHAVHLKTGEVAWRSPSDWSLDHVLGGVGTARDPQKIGAYNQWISFFVGSNQRPGILFENSVLGSLSADTRYAYAVEDLALPPQYVQQMEGRIMPGGGGFNPFGNKVGAAVKSNKLQAFALASGGKLDWEVGGEDEKGELADSFFLGPPLPLAGKLYVLTEKQQELRLVCLDPAAKGKVVSAQLLASTKDVKLSNDPLRRTQAAHLSYAEGLLVIPTNAGAVFGVDLLSNSLVWAYPYREKTAGPAAPGTGPGGVKLPPGALGRPGMPGMNGASLTSYWRVTAPVVQDGKVVFTAPDARSIHCISLRDGLPVWTQTQRDDDLYLAGVFNGKVVVVGKGKTRALSLARGDTVWELDTGVPSGQGAASALKPGEASDIIYYLPVRESVSTNEPEICAINVDKGLIHAHTKSRKKEVPGNLLFYEGDVIAQNQADLVAYPQLEIKLALMNDKVRDNATDPDALTERGDYLLDKGDLAGAISDFRKALANKPTPPTRVKARSKLYEALTEYVQRDFNAAEEYLKEYEELCKVDLDGSTPEERVTRIQEERRRRANFLCLVGKGRESQNRLVDAFEKYLELGQEARKDELIQVVDEPSVKAAPDVWSQGRIAAMVANARDAAQKAALERLINDRWKKLQESRNPSAEDLRKFVALFGSLFGVGKEARLALAEKLMEDADVNSLLEAEQQLSLLRGTNEKPEVAARAVEALARLNTRKGLLEDAAYYYRLLGQNYPKVVVAEGKTGQDYLDDLLTDKRFLLHLDGPGGFNLKGKVKVTAREERGAPVGAPQVFEFGQSGEALPFFARHRLGLRMDVHRLKLVDSATGEERWDLPLTRTQFQIFATLSNGQPNQQPHRLKFTYQNVGHLVVLQLGHMVFGIDPLNKGRILWERNLSNLPGAASAPPGHSALVFDPRDETAVVQYTDGFVQRLGQAGPLQGGVVCLQTRDSLTAIDPVSGRTLWTRSDVNSRTQVFGDEEHIYTVGLSETGSAVGSRVFRAYDGVNVRVPDFANAYDKRVRMVGRNILYSETDAKGTLHVKIWDVLEGKTSWQEKFAAPGSVLCKSEDERLAGVVEPTGELRVIDLVARKEVMKGKLDDTAAIAKAQSMALLADGDNIYLAVNGQADANLVPWGGGVQSNMQPGLGFRAVPVNGEFYTFDRATGKRLWYTTLRNQMLILARFEEMPIVFFASRSMEWVGGPAARSQVNVSAAHAFVKKNGKAAYENKAVQPGMFFHELALNPRAGKVDVAGFNLKVTFTVEADGK